MPTDSFSAGVRSSFLGSGYSRVITVKFLIVGLIRVYQKVISPFLPRACRFHPSCSEYMCQAIQKFGVAKGSWLGIKRLSRCHPWHPGGYDPVP